MTNQKVLKTSRYWMNCIGLCVESNECNFGSIKAPVWLVRFIYSVPMSTLIFLAFWHVIESSFDLIVSSISIFVIVGAGQVQLIYLSLAAKNSMFIEMFERLQKLVDASECSKPFIAFFGEKKIFVKKILFRRKKYFSGKE